MVAYRYLVFPCGKQPTVGEVSELKSFAGLLANHFAWGACRDDGRLALACERGAFDHGRQVDAGFDALVGKREVRGCELVDHLGFVKDSAALRPVPSADGQFKAKQSNNRSMPEGVAGSDLLRPDAMLAAKKLIGHEAVARSLLSVQRTLERYSAIQRLAGAMPYVLLLLGAFATIAVGAWVRERMLNSGRERRQETIERVVDDPLRESLATGAKSAGD